MDDVKDCGYNCKNTGFNASTSLFTRTLVKKHTRCLWTKRMALCLWEKWYRVVKRKREGKRVRGIWGGIMRKRVGGENDRQHEKKSNWKIFKRIKRERDYEEEKMVIWRCLKMWIGRLTFFFLSFNMDE